MSGTLHPALIPLAETMASLDLPPISEQSVEQVRAGADSWAQMMGPGPECARVEDIEIPVRHGTVSARYYLPEGEPDLLVVYFHGGGWVSGSVESYDAVTRMVAVEARAAVISVEYRRAPEAQFPAGLEDCVDALRWAAKEVERLAGRKIPLVAMGDSAGGNLATAALLELKRLGENPVAAQVLLYPATDYGPNTASYQEFWEGPIFGGNCVEWFWRNYVPEGTDTTHSRISPLRATDLAGLPPAVVVTMEFDPLRDEGEAYAEALKAAGVPVIARRIPGVTHGFFAMLGIFDDPKPAMRQVRSDVDVLLGR